MSVGIISKIRFTMYCHTALLPSVHALTSAAKEAGEGVSLASE
jgi:hypothetical protein